jgi:hypothetical protein
MDGMTLRQAQGERVSHEAPATSAGQAAKTQKNEAKRAEIADVMLMIEDGRWGDRPGVEAITTLQGMGFSIKISAWNNTIRWRGISASCTWSETHGLIKAWHGAAARWLERQA